ncbi:uncharacterized protein LOC113310393 isoform X1 [Papaver somniferum]|uniref:uncharacterized protein LOC113310393 isoform X1 n=1 Tax=Papaver somniferum TaxID=3469 RepID=UPI000E6FA98F|nr:uncharacterized protein LOC113310393 isoform X1 [Papaver somniferum]XP_026414845.1 uncharacterized protein LOC113310393 isoform X1 [Papaver somniferum]
MKTLAVIYFGAVKKKIPTNFSLTDRDLTLWHCNRTPHAMDFLKAIPIHGLNQAITPRQFRSFLMYQLGMPLFSKDSMCSNCNGLMYVFGDHAVHCAGEVGQKFRHYVVKDVLADMCYKAGVVARKEVSLGFSSNNVYSLRPADILFYNWEDGKDVCMDVTGVSPFTSARTRNFTPGHAISATVTRKRDKYLDTCTAQGYGFVVLAFSTLGELGSEMISFLQRLRNCLVSHDANHKIGDSLFFRLGVVIQKGIGAQLVARIPAPNV